MSYFKFDVFFSNSPDERRPNQPCNGRVQRTSIVVVVVGVGVVVVIVVVAAEEEY